MNTNLYNNVKQIYSYKKDDADISILVDNLSNLYWRNLDDQLVPLLKMPWRFQVPFYLTFLHNDELASRFKDMEIIEAIDLFIRENYL